MSKDEGMITIEKKTEFAPADRLGRQDIRRQAELISKTPLFSRHLDIIPDPVMILNEHRQIVFANSAALDLIKVKTTENLHGMRPGEALNCIHATQSEYGCGTTSFCKNCGAVTSILSGFKGFRSVEECHITPAGGGSPYDFRITTSPYFIEDERFVVFIAVNISNEKRREVLERIFFHDVNNTLNALLGSVELMPQHKTEEENVLAKSISTGVHMLVNDIGTQQSLLAAEDGSLTLLPKNICSLDFLEEVITFYKHYECAENRDIQINESSTNDVFISDKNQLSRIIGNMLKNALEASSAPDTVTAGCEQTNIGSIRFWVHNPQCIPHSVRGQIFNRSFSTKGFGRGVGTYSMKLLGERFLNGSVTFISSPDEGTTFSVEIPLFLAL